MGAAKKGVVYVKFSGLNKGVEGEVYERATEDATTDDPVGKTDIWCEALHGHHDGATGRTMSATFTRKEVCKLFELTEGRLKYWDKTAFISPSGFAGQRRCYTFGDLIGIRSALALLDSGVSLQKTRTMLGQLGRLLPKTTHPLGKLRITGDSSKVTVTEEGREFEVDSGQLLIDFTVKNMEEEVISSLPEYAERANARTAYEWYLEACKLDEEEETLDAAEHAYHQSILLDPELANAYTNLGNLRYRRGAGEDARALYLKALEVDENQPEAQYNLGFLDFEEGSLESAHYRFERSVRLDPTFADAYFNLAMTSYKLGDLDSATKYWKDYLDLEPEGSWAEIARRHLAEM